MKRSRLSRSRHFPHAEKRKGYGTLVDSALSGQTSPVRNLPSLTTLTSTTTHSHGVSAPAARRPLVDC